MSSNYPQAPPFLNDQELEQFLARPLLARFGTHNEDGTIHIAPLYYLYDQGVFWFGTQEVSRKIRNIRRDERVTVMIDSPEPVLQSVLIYGTAQLDYDDLVTKRVRIVERYFDSPENASSFVERLTKAWKTVIIRVQPTQMVSIDYSQPWSID